MSEGGFHVHGPHDHELEHLTQHGAGDSFTGRIAVTTSLLATVGGGQGGAADCDSAGRDRFIDAKKMVAVGCLWLERFWDRLGAIGPGTPLKPKRRAISGLT